MSDLPPVLVTAFNRPTNLEYTLRSLVNFDTKIYVALDAAKLDDERNLIKVKECREVIKKFESKLSGIRISEFNQGCHRGVTNAINWVFERESSLVILEDDIVVDSNFLNFAQQMLSLYESDMRVGGVSGMNMVPREFQANPQKDYRFSMFTSSWGWATWQNRWVKFEHVLDLGDREVFNWPTNYWSYWNLRYWKNIFQKTMSPESDSWAYRWQYANWKHRMLTITPNSNLTLNVGFGDDSTHTFDKIAPWWLPTEITPRECSTFEIVSVERDVKADRWLGDNHYRTKPIHQIKNQIRYRFPRLVGFLTGR
jgi:hypothetical protein